MAYVEIEIEEADIEDILDSYNFHQIDDVECKVEEVEAYATSLEERLVDIETCLNVDDLYDLFKARIMKDKSVLSEILQTLIDGSDIKIDWNIEKRGLDINQTTLDS